MELSGKVCLVTGASNGIGAALAVAVLERHGRVDVLVLNAGVRGEGVVATVLAPAVSGWDPGLVRTELNPQGTEDPGVAADRLVAHIEAAKGSREPLR